MDDLLFLDSTEIDEYGTFDGDSAGEDDEFYDSDDGGFYDTESEDEYGEFDEAEAAEGRKRRMAMHRGRIMRAKRRARRLQRQRAMQRKRAAAIRRRPRRRPANRIAKNRRNIQKVGLDSAVKSDMLASGLRSQSKRIGGTENAIAASKVVEEFTAQFPELKNNKLVKSGLPLAPLLFLKPPKKGSGVQSVATDARVWSTALAAGAALFNEFRDNDSEAQEISINPGSLVLAANNSFRLSAIVRNKSGKIVGDRKIVWASLDAETATVDASTGDVKTIAAGDVMIVATDTATGLTNAVTIKVT